MGIVLLASKCLERRAVQNLRILTGRVFGLVYILTDQNSVNIPHTNGLVHAPEGLIHVVHLRCTLRHLQLRLRHGDALRHREDIGVRNRQHINTLIKILAFDGPRLAGHVIGVVIRQIFCETLGQQLKFKLLGIVQPLMDGRHDRRAFFQQCNRGPNGRSLVAVAYLQVRDGGHAATRIHAEPKQGHQGLTWLLVGQRKHGTLKLNATCVHVPPFSRLQGHIVVHDPSAFGLEARWKVAQSACVYQLAKCRRGGLAQTTNQLQKP